MEFRDHIAAVRRESDAFDTALRDGPLDARVPSCPEWTLADLALHVGEFAGWWTHILCEGSGRAKPVATEPSGGDGIIDWCVDWLGTLVAELEATPSDTTVWTWAEEDKTARFPARRAANELAVHRFDAQLARGKQQPIESTLAVDGIDEIFVMIANRGVPAGGSGETMHLHATDCDAEWMLTIGADSIDMRHEHAKGDSAVRAAVSDLELLLYQRPPLGSVEQFGDDRPLELFYRVFCF